ncbi:MAG: hypothetical protein ABSE81_06265 [Candidatus Omnitrophota bacterium]|jgi:hypothetical protein
MEKKRSVGIIVFGILMILGSLVQLPVGISSYSVLLKPLPESVIIVRDCIMKLLLILGAISGVGILWLKDIFRKIAVFLSVLVILDYIIQLPFFVLKNIPDFIHQQTIKTTAMNPTISQHFHSSLLWTSAILAWAIDIGFAICVIYFFTRPKVKDQFK